MNEHLHPIIRFNHIIERISGKTAMDEAWDHWASLEEDTNTKEEREKALRSAGMATLGLLLKFSLFFGAVGVITAKITGR